MSESIYLLDESVSSPANTSNMCTKGLNLSKDFISNDHVADIYKNNNNNIEDAPGSPSTIHDNIVNYGDNLGEEKVFKRRESLSEECKMNTTPNERERASIEDENNGDFSSLQRINSSLEETCDDNGGKLVAEQEPSYSASSDLQKRSIFNSNPSERDHSRNPSPEYSHVNPSSDGHLSQRDMEQPALPPNFLGAEGDNNEEMSENEMICDDYESDSESNEPRITVREALMNRALAAAAAASSSSSQPNFSACIDRSGEAFVVSEPGESGRTSRSGGMSPSSSPRVRSSNTRGRNENSPNIPSNKEPFLNGHSGLRPVNYSGERYYHPHGHHQHQSHLHRSSFGAHTAHQQGYGSHSKHSQPVKSECKSHSSSPILSDVKPENLATLSNLNNIQNSIGNALLNLASLGSLAALQQSLPGLLSSVGGTSSTSEGNASESPSRTSPRIGASDTFPAVPSINAPLNLTHSSVGGGSLPTNYRRHHQIGHASNSNHLKSQRSSSPTGQFALQSSFSHKNSMAVGNPSSMLAGGGIIPANLSSYFGQSTSSGGVSGSGSSPFIPNSSQLSNSLSVAAASLQTPGSLPQLVLASGQIMQGIQGAQLLIPTAQGIMTQMILTIPLTQPGSPQNLINTTTQQNTTSPTIGASSGQSISSPQSRSNRIPNRSHHQGLAHCNTNSPPISATVPPSTSPDYSGTAGAIQSSLLNLSPHLVNPSLGAHIPLDKMGIDRTGGMNGVRSTSLKRDSMGMVITSNTNLYPPKLSPRSGSGHESDKGSDAEDSDQMVDGINLDEIKEFAKAFKLRRLSLGLTQTQVGQALSVTEGPAYSQSAICSALAWQLAQSHSQLSQSNRTSLPQPSMFEKLDITPKSAQKIKPVLERWMKEAEDRYKNGHQNLNEFVGMEPSKKRKRRTSFTPQALEILNTQFERNTHPSGAEITTLAHQLGYEREVIRIWFCNKRQALKNTVRMMSKGSSPI